MLQFAKDISIAQLRYRAFVNEGMSEKYRIELSFRTRESRLLGDDIFMQDVLKKTILKLNPKVRVEDIIKVVCNLFKLDLNKLVA